jgi:hypothetical protein
MATGAVGEERGEADGERWAQLPFVQPKGRGAPISNLDSSNVPVKGETLVDNPLQERGGFGGFPQITTCNREEPTLPRQGVRCMEGMNKIKQQAPVLPVEILDAETSLLHRQHRLVPSDKTTSTRAGILPSPEESTASLVNPVNNPTGKQVRTHVVCSKIIQN